MKSRRCQALRQYRQDTGQRSNATSVQYSTVQPATPSQRNKAMLAPMQVRASYTPQQHCRQCLRQMDFTESASRTNSLIVIAFPECVCAHALLHTMPACTTTPSTCRAPQPALSKSAVCSRTIDDLMAQNESKLALKLGCRARTSLHATLAAAAAFACKESAWAAASASSSNLATTVLRGRVSGVRGPSSLQSDLPQLPGSANHMCHRHAT